MFIRDTTVSASNFESVVLNVQPNTVLYFDTSSLINNVNAQMIPITASWALTASVTTVFATTISASWASSSIFSTQVSASQIIGSDYILTGSYVNFVSTSYTMSVVDNGALLSVSGSSTINLFLSSSLPYGFNCTVYQSGSGKAVVLTSSVQTVLRNRQGLSGSAGQYALMSLIRIQEGEFVLAGDTA